MSKLAPWLLTPLAFFACSSVALADEPPPKMDMGSAETTGGDTTTTGGDTTTTGGDTTTTGGESGGEESKGCAVSPGNDVLIGFGALVLLVSGVALRRRED